MLTLFALMLQTATLDADTAKAAMTCATAITVADSGAKSQMRLTSQFMHLTMQVARAKPAGPLFDQLNRLSEEAAKAPAMTADHAKSLVPACDKRFPLARSSAPARLPGDAFRRDVLCFGVLSLLKGTAEEIGPSVDADLTRIKAGMKPLFERLTDVEMDRRGLGSDDAFLKALGDEMLAALPSGNPMTLAAACGVSLS